MQGEFPYYGPTGILDWINEHQVEGQYTLLSEDGDHFLKYAEAQMTILVDGKFNVNNHAHLVAGNTGCSTKWVYYFYNHANLGPFITRQGVGRYKLTKEALKKLPLLVPPPDEQDAVVRILSAWDLGIEQLKRLVALKERRKRALMQQLLTGKLRFLEFVKSTATRKTKFGPRPEDWTHLRIGEFAEEAGDRNRKGKDIPVLSCTKHTGLVSSLEYFGKRVFSADTADYKVVMRNQFAYATNHIEEGSIGLLDFLDIGLVSPMYTVFATDDQVDVHFLFALFKTELYRHIFEVHTNASVNRRGSLRWNDFQKIPVSLPPIDEQRRIAGVLQTCNLELDLLRARLAALKRQKYGLMQKLLTGEVRVSA